MPHLIIILDGNYSGISFHSPKPFWWDYIAYSFSTIFVKYTFAIGLAYMKYTQSKDQIQFKLCLNKTQFKII